LDIKESMDSLRTEVANLGNRVSEAEERVSKLEDGQTNLADITGNLNGRVAQLEARVQYMENYSRRNNLRIKGIQENTEREGNVTDCVRDVLRCLFPNEEEVNDIVIERAHRVPTMRQRDRQDRQGPRHILVRFLRYGDREKVRIRARELREFHWKGMKVDFFPDFTKEVQDKRSKFTEIRHLCMKKGLRYTLQYPAVFWVTLDGTRQRFEDPAAAKRSIISYQQPDAGE
uniref:L1 transposable element RRM domain-containing protein n=1 Tax=Neogobius melanostomus TaxID=47308 RepID=A0A8C6T262_9GOBI